MVKFLRWVSSLAHHPQGVAAEAGVGGRAFRRTPIAIGVPDLEPMTNARHRGAEFPAVYRQSPAIAHRAVSALPRGAAKSPFAILVE